MLRSLWKLQWKQFAARMKKGNGKKTSGGWLVFLMLFLVVCMEILMFVGILTTYYGVSIKCIT